MDTKKVFHYFDLEKQEREAIVNYLLQALLRARKNCHLPSGEKMFDEDVNVYLAHLMFASTLSDYQELVGRYLSLSTGDLVESIEKNNDKVVRYFIYKVNADYLLIHLGIFHDLLPNASRRLAKSEHQWAEMGQSYYGHASQYNHQIYRKNTAVGEVLEKLAFRFEDYKKILESVSDEFFHLIKEMALSDTHGECCGGKLTHLIGSLELERKQNEFLDLYGKYLKTNSKDIIEPLAQAAKELKALDPSFDFPLNSIMS
jgi:hypothetical protein